MVDYSQTKIYKIVCRKTGLVYIGATVRQLEIRLRQHQTRQDCTSLIVMINNDYYIELIEEFPCETLKESNRREGFHIQKNECVNRTVLGRTRKEYREEHKDEIAEKKKRYREEHKDEIAERKKRYQEEHKDEISKKGKIYREEHKDEIAERKKETYECDCGSTLRKEDKARHNKSKKHQAYLATL
jgi:hypothetical protein